MFSLLRRMVLVASVFGAWFGEQFIDQLRHDGDLLAAIRTAFEDGFAEAAITWRNDYYAAIPYHELPWWLEILRQNKEQKKIP